MDGCAAKFTTSNVPSKSATPENKCIHQIFK
jgi:hypothetical protein